MRKLIITILLLLPLSAIAADKTFSAGESLTLTSNTTWDSAYSNATKTDWAVVTGAYNITINDVANLKYVSFQNTGTITISVNSI